jgi:hypothetical protein
MKQKPPGHQIFYGGLFFVFSTVGIIGTVFQWWHLNQTATISIGLLSVAIGAAGYMLLANELHELAEMIFAAITWIGEVAGQIVVLILTIPVMLLFNSLLFAGIIWQSSSNGFTDMVEPYVPKKFQTAAICGIIVADFATALGLASGCLLLLGAATI